MYTVKKGDTLANIARAHGMSLNQLLNLNGISKEAANLIRIGQKIKTDISTKVGSTVNRTKEQIKNLQQQLVNAGFNLGNFGDNKNGVDGNWGKLSQEALNNAYKAGYKVVNGILQAPKSEHRKINIDTNNAAKVVTNTIKNPRQALVDVTLYAADKMGVPSNATNYLRDINVSVPYRTKSAITAGIKTIFNDKSFEENYNHTLKNPDIITKLTTINPLTNTNSNFSEEELAAIRSMAGSNFNITNADIKRVSENGKYGGVGSVFSYFSPTKVVQTALGQTSGNAKEKTITDTFDVNTQSATAKRDNQKYVTLAKDTPGFNYQTMRATMPWLNSIDIMPDEFKVHTKIKYEK